MKAIAAVLPLLALGACAVGPNYRPPDIAVPAHFSEALASTAGKSPADATLASWWRKFDDPVLDRLVTDALAQNLDIRIARSRITEARFQLRLAGAQLLPSIDATAGASHIHFSKNAGLSSLASLFGGSGSGGTGSGSGASSGNGIAAPGGGVTTYSTGFDASWEIDAFGGARRGVEAAAADVGAAVWSARDAKVSLVAEIADDYFKLRALQQRTRVLRQETKRESGILRIVQDTASVGLVPRTDSLQQKSQIDADRAALADLEARRRVLVHVLAVLLARPSSQLPPELTQGRTVATDLPPVVPPGLPSDLLRRRPDIRAAERRLAAATARVGMATADLYPHFTLTGVGEFISTALSDMFAGGSLQLMAGGAIRFPLLDFGRGKARVGSARAKAQQAYLDYKKTVIGALRDVDDALVRYRSERDRSTALARRLENARRALRAANAEYGSGLVDYSDVYQAEIALLQARDQRIQSEALQREALVSLYKALGGGWHGAKAGKAKANADARS